MMSRIGTFLYILSEIILVLGVLDMQIDYTVYYIKYDASQYQWSLFLYYYNMYTSWIFMIFIPSFFLLILSFLFNTKNSIFSALILYPLAYIPFAYIPLYLYKFFTRNIPREREPLRVFTFKLTSGLLGLVSKNNKE